MWRSNFHIDVIMEQKLSTKFKVGDSVVVNRGVKDPGMGDNLSGWQGRITAINKHEEYDDQNI